MRPCRSGVVLCIALVLPALVAPSPLTAQLDTSQVMIAGFVIDPSRNPIEGAEVRVVGTARSVLTSRAGTFQLFTPRVKEILIQIRRPSTARRSRSGIRCSPSSYSRDVPA